MIVLMGRDYVSELRPPTGLLFIPHGEPWWNDIDKEKLLICPPEIFGNPTSSLLVASQEKLGEGNYKCSIRSIFVHNSK
jgi:hypothetical protein